MLEGDWGSLGILVPWSEAKARNPGGNPWNCSIQVSPAVPCPNPSGSRAGHPCPDGATRNKGMFGNLIPKERPHPAGNFGWIKAPQGPDALTHSEVCVGQAGKESQENQKPGFGKIPWASLGILAHRDRVVLGLEIPVNPGWIPSIPLQTQLLQSQVVSKELSWIT